MLPPLWNEIIDLYPPPMPVGYPPLLGKSMGGGERAPVALCREPTEPAGETRGWAAPNSPNRQARPGGTTNPPAAHLPPPDVVKAAVVEQVLLGQAGVAAKGFGVRAGEEQCHGPLHPHVQGEALRLVKAVEQGALRHLGPHPVDLLQLLRPSSTGERATRSRSTSPAATFLAASSRYLARNPARRGPGPPGSRRRASPARGSCASPCPRWAPPAAGTIAL